MKNFSLTQKKILDFLSKIHYNNKHKEERNINMSIKYTEAYRKELIETLREASKIENPTEMEQKMFAFVIDLWRIIRKEETKPDGTNCANSSNCDVEFVSSEEAKSLNH